MRYIVIPGERNNDDGRRLYVQELAAIAAKYNLRDRASIVRVAYYERFGESLSMEIVPTRINGGREKPLVSVYEHSAGFEVVRLSDGKRHWLSDGVDVITVPLSRHKGRYPEEMEEVTLRPGLPYFLEAWEDSLNATPDDTEAAYFS